MGKQTENNRISVIIWYTYYRLIIVIFVKHLDAHCQKSICIWLNSFYVIHANPFHTSCTKYYILAKVLRSIRKKKPWSSLIGLYTGSAQNILNDFILGYQIRFLNEAKYLLFILRKTNCLVKHLWFVISRKVVIG